MSVVMTALALLSGCATPAREFARSIPDPDAGAVVRGVPVYEAEENQQAAAALASVLHYWKRPGLVQRVSERMAGRNPADTDITPLLEHYLGQEGLWVYAGRGTLDDVRSRIRNGVPVITPIQKEPLDGSTLRIVVITGFDDTRDQVLLHAGKREAETMSYADFNTYWHQALGFLLTICPPRRAAWSFTADEWTSRGKFFEARRQYQAALQDYLAALDREPGNVDSYINAGDMYRALGQPREAERYYRAALALDDLNARAGNNLAFLLAEENRNIDEAVRLARRATQQEPDNPNMLDTLGFALYRDGNLHDAARMLSRARARAAGLPPHLQAEIGMRLVTVYSQQDLPHLARQVLADVLSVHPRMTVPPEFQSFVRPDQPVSR